MPEKEKLTEKEKLEEIYQMIDQMAEQWPSDMVASTEIERFSSGIIHKKTIANECSRGTGPDGKFLLCGKTIYRKAPLTAWMKGKAATGWRVGKRGSNR